MWFKKNQRKAEKPKPHTHKYIVVRVAHGQTITGPVTHCSMKCINSDSICQNPLKDFVARGYFELEDFEGINYR